MTFTIGQVAVGGANHYVEVINQNGTFAQMLHVLDLIHGSADTQTFITGVAFNPRTGDLATCSTPTLTADFAPHDICWFPDNSGYLVAIVPSSGVLHLVKYALNATTVLHTWTGLAVDATWARQAVKISISCDSKFVYYTDSMRTIFVYNLETSMQEANYEQLPVGSSYIYSGIRFLPAPLAKKTQTGGLELGPVLVVAMTLTGSGPRRALAIGADQSVWTDEVNPTGQYHVYKRKLLDGSLLIPGVVTRADLTPTNGQTLSLSCYYDGCGFATGTAEFMLIHS